MVLLCFMLTLRHENNFAFLSFGAGDTRHLFMVMAVASNKALQTSLASSYGSKRAGLASMPWWVEELPITKFRMALHYATNQRQQSLSKPAPKYTDFHYPGFLAYADTISLPSA